MDLFSLILLLVAVATLVALVLAVSRTVRGDGYGAPRPDPQRGWFAPLNPR